MIRNEKNCFFQLYIVLVKSVQFISTVSNLDDEEGKEWSKIGKKNRGMICEHWAKESHTIIHLCQDGREERAGEETIRCTSVGSRGRGS